EEVLDRLRQHFADAFYLVEFGDRVLARHRLQERRDGRIAARDQPCIGFADMADAERIDETVHCDSAPLIDGGDQIVHELALGLLVLLGLLDLAFPFLGAPSSLSGVLARRKISAGSFSSPFSCSVSI